jgi:hypothetical protein
MVCQLDAVSITAAVYACGGHAGCGDKTYWKWLKDQRKAWVFVWEYQINEIPQYLALIKSAADCSLQCTSLVATCLLL